MKNKLLIALLLASIAQNINSFYQVQAAWEYGKDIGYESESELWRRCWPKNHADLDLMRECIELQYGSDTDPLVKAWPSTLEFFKMWAGL